MRIPRAVSLFLLLGLAARNGLALDPQRAISQFVHSSWTERDGAPSNVRALAQTQDGYLWIGTTAGLFRFDGVRFTAFELPAEEAFPSTRVRGLLAARDGALWIVWAGGAVSRLQNGHSTSYSDRDGLPAAEALVEADDGTIVAATVKGLSRFEHGVWKDATTEWNFPGKQARLVYFDRNGSLWAATENRVVYLPRGQSHFIDPGNTLGFAFNLAQAPDGAIWVSEFGISAHTIQKEDDGKRGTELKGGASWVLFDRDGSLWVASLGDGLRRVPYPDRIRGKQIAHFGPEAEHFTAKNGLSSSQVFAILEDREGNIWCGTQNGLDRFRPGAFLAVDVQSPDLRLSAFATKDGNLWTSTYNPGDIVRLGPNGAKEVVGTGYAVKAVCEDDRGALWFVSASDRPFYRFRQGRIANVPLPAGTGLKNIGPIACDHAGGVWLFDVQRGLFRLTDGGLVKIADSSDPDYVSPVLSTDSRDRVWLGQRDSIEMFDHGSRRTFSASDGLTVKSIRVFAEDKAGNVWAGGQGGLVKFDHDRFRSLSRSNGLPAQSVSGLTEDDAGYWWIACDAGVLRIRAEEMEHALSDPNYRPPYELFDLLDGLPARPVVQPMPVLTKTIDGRIWVATGNGIAYLDPRGIPRNQVLPPVRVESVKVNGKETAPTDGLTLAPGPNDLEIDYTALSFTIPERVRFKYKLEGHDSDWKDGGGRRQAYYGGLAPKDYRFRVIAANDSGVWNEAGASFDFSIAPAYYQTHWFQAACAAAFLALLWGLYRYRLHQIAREFNMRLDERVGERTRLARDLHDTLLQGFQGLMLRLQAIDESLPEGEIKDELERTLDRGDQVVTESRKAVHDLRLSTVITNDLARAVRAVGNELSGESSATFGLVVEGETRELHPIVRDEIYRITREALRNAFSHARARRIEAEIIYGEHLFRLRIRDDGEGIAPALLEKGRLGHYGLRGMRERAAEIGAKLDIWSGAGTGTEIDLSIAGSIAYGKRRKD
jgi:signal transduction histidine kinase/ligand-binding sensor domain-containing protein